jgi:hypothetical protein
LSSGESQGRDISALYPDDQHDGEESMQEALASLQEAQVRRGRFVIYRFYSIDQSYKASCFNAAIGGAQLSELPTMQTHLSLIVPITVIHQLIIYDRVPGCCIIYGKRPYKKDAF